MRLPENKRLTKWPTHFYTKWPFCLDYEQNTLGRYADN
jgi:hypothetical protein